MTTHSFHIAPAEEMPGVPNDSVALIVTSPPYPMISMWDEGFTNLNPKIGRFLSDGKPMLAFRSMHEQLDHVWKRCHDVLNPGGFLCVNIGDAVRTFNGEFSLFPNHARITMALMEAGFTVLPDIVWHKPTNAPNKFMGSGVLPAGAYVTYEHESVLVARKGSKRAFVSRDEKAARQRSAIFFEERNVWFSDIWRGLTGVRQGLKRSEARERSGAFPFELPFRLVQMFSLQRDLVLDPFAGTGTTMAAAAASGRNSIGFDVLGSLQTEVRATFQTLSLISIERQIERLQAHQEFVRTRLEKGKSFRHQNQHYAFPVTTTQERNLVLDFAEGVTEVKVGVYEVEVQSLGPSAISKTTTEPGSLPFDAASPE